MEVSLSTGDIGNCTMGWEKRVRVPKCSLRLHCVETGGMVSRVADLVSRKANYNVNIIRL